LIRLRNRALGSWRRVKPAAPPTEDSAREQSEHDSPNQRELDCQSKNPTRKEKNGSEDHRHEN
jgi:hypothetical protein